jgi:hypothetical protein
MKKVIALSTLLALSALGMACGGETTNTAANANKTVANAMNSAGNAVNAAGNAVNAAGNAVNAAGNAANAATNSVSNAMKPANAATGNSAMSNAAHANTNK